MSILIRGATILAMGGPNGREPFQGDVHIVGDRIEAIGPHLEGVEADTVIDGRDRLVMPGLSNGHLHSSEALLKGGTTTCRSSSGCCSHIRSSGRHRSMRG
jgi:cytosine/adenosine deaminase-related metal-dependent hydrolase